VYGAEVVNGWLGKLFPYTRDFQTGEYSRRNDLLDPQVEAEIRKLEAEEARDKGGRWPRVNFRAPGVRPEDLPRGLSRVPFTFKDGRGELAMEFLAGPAVVTQDAATLALRPTLGWAVREAPPIEQALARLARHELTPAGGQDFWERLRELRSDYVPTDVVRFLQACDGAALHGGLYRVLPFAEWCEPKWLRREVVRGDRVVAVSGPLRRFANLADGTELLLGLDCPEPENRGAVFVGRNLDGTLLADTGRRVARSFTEFLLRALDGVAAPYFRAAGFAPPGPDLG
jgi:hypothetical protein